jgi:HTH-type transcriptional regulator/antitoxin HigA
MKPKILKSEEEYEAALERVGELMSAEPGTPEEDDLELWSMLVEDYEKRHYPIAPPDPVEAIKFRMDQLGLQQKDLTRYIPAKSNISEVLGGKRKLSLSMIRALHDHLGIPAEVLVREVKLSTTKPRRPRASTKPASRKIRKKAQPKAHHTKTA